MKRKRLDLLFGVLAAALLLLASVVYLNAYQQSTIATRRTWCCFTNRDYEGVCTVQPAKNETCASILKYLNTAGTVGKTYCNNTTIRGGWQQVKCR